MASLSSAPAPTSEFLDKVTVDGKYSPEAGRYVLYVSLGCPFAMRAAMVWAIKGLQEAIELCIVDYHYVQVGHDGKGQPRWGLQFTTSDKVAACSPDPIMNARFLKDLYTKAAPEYAGSATVPILWDRQTNTIVNNDSRSLMHILDSGFERFSKNPVNLHPANLKEEMEKNIMWGLHSIMGTSRLAGTATTQEDYENHAKALKKALLEVDETLSKSKFILGSQITAADIALFNIVIRHDIITVYLSRVNHIFIRDLPHIMRWIRDVLDIPGLRKLVNIEHIKGMSFSKRAFNPTGIIPLGDGFTLP